MSQSLLKTGLSLPFTESELKNIEYIPECFEYVELSGEALADMVELRKTHPLWSEFEFCNFRNIISSNLTCQLTSENKVIVQEYKKQLRELFSQAMKCKAGFVSIDPDWETLCSDSDRMKIFADVLSSTAGDRNFYNIELLISVRLPGSGAVPATESLQMLRKLPSHRVKLALDINPHELINSNIEWGKLLRKFRFDAPVIRFCYASELGNKLLYSHIGAVIEELKKLNQEFFIYLAPSGKADLEELAETAQAINGKSNDESQR